MKLALVGAEVELITMVLPFSCEKGKKLRPPALWRTYIETDIVDQHPVQGRFCTESEFQKVFGMRGSLENFVTLSKNYFEGLEEAIVVDGDFSMNSFRLSWPEVQIKEYIINVSGPYCWFWSLMMMSSLFEPQAKRA